MLSNTSSIVGQLWPHASVSNQRSWPQWYSSSVADSIVTPPLASVYPLDALALSRSFEPPTSDTTACSFANLFLRLDAGENIRLSVIGGSATFGIDCAYQTENSTCNENCCAWPRSLATWLKIVRPSWNIEVVNNALPGVGVETWATASLPAADFYILATSVNSQSLEPDVIVKSGLQLVERLHYHINRRLSQSVNASFLVPAILWLSEFRTCSQNIGDCHFHCGDQTMQDGRGHFFCPFWWRVADIESEVVSSSGLPRANYRNAVWPSMPAPPNLAAVWGRGLSHPSPGPHELISDVVKYALAQLYASYGVKTAADLSFQCSPKPDTVIPPSLRSGSMCTTRSEIFAREIFDKGTNDNGIWGLREDVRGKAGWIADGLRDPGAIKSFEIDISAGAGSNPVVVIYYLTSYERMGTAMIGLTAPLSDGTKCSANVTLNGKSSAHTSVTTPFAWALAGGDADWPASCAPERLQLTSPGSGKASARIDIVDNTGVGKFKLIGLRTC